MSSIFTLIQISVLVKYSFLLGFCFCLFFFPPLKTIQPIRSKILILVQYLLETKERLLTSFFLHTLLFFIYQSISNLLSQLN